MDAFIQGQTDKEAALSALASEPETLDEAVSFVKKAIHNRRAVFGEHSMSPKKTTVHFDEPKLHFFTLEGTTESPDGSQGIELNDLNCRISSIESTLENILKHLSKFQDQENSSGLSAVADTQSQYLA